MRLLLYDHRAGRLRPCDVRLGEMPTCATSLMRGIAADMRLRMGLRLAVDDDRPLPYAPSEAVGSGLARHKMQASRAIRQLWRRASCPRVPRRTSSDGARADAAPRDGSGHRARDARGCHELCAALPGLRVPAVRASQLL